MKAAASGALMRNFDQRFYASALEIQQRRFCVGNQAVNNGGGILMMHTLFYRQHRLRYASSLRWLNDRRTSRQ